MMEGFCRETERSPLLPANTLPTSPLETDKLEAASYSFYGKQKQLNINDLNVPVKKLDEMAFCYHVHTSQMSLQK